MDLSMYEEETANIMIASTQFEVEARETLSVIEEVLTDKFRVLNLAGPIHI